MPKIIVRNTKTGDERPMEQKSFDYLLSKKRGFEFVRKVEQPKSEVQLHMDRLKAEKAQNQDESVIVESEVKTPAKRGPKPKSAAE
jgi:hypothetical protein